MTYYSPGVEYLCPICDSDLVRFVFDVNYSGIDSTTKLIKAKKVSLTDSFDEYVANSAAPKWICKECYDCGIVLF